MRRALVVIAALLLSACHIDATVEIAVKDDGSGTVTLTAFADAGVVGQAPGLADDLRFDDAEAAGWMVTGPIETGDGGLRVTVAHDFANPEEATALLRSINGSGGPMHDIIVGRTVAESGTTVTVSGTLRIDGLAAFADPEVLGAVGATPYAEQVDASNASPSEAVGITIRAVLPGKITSPNGEVGSGAVSWVVPLDGSHVDLAATAVDDHGTAKIWGVAATVALIALVAWCVIAAAFITWVVRQRNRRARSRRPPAM